MPEIHIAEIETTDEKELRRQAKIIEDLDQIASFAEWFETQSETVKALGAELAEIQAARGMNPRFQVDTEERYGRPLYVAHCANGRHESRQSPEHAMFLLVDSFRTRAEDRPETHERLMQMHGCTVKEARRLAAEIAAELRAKHPGTPGETRDKLFENEVAKAERELVARKNEAKERKVPVKK